MLHRIRTARAVGATDVELTWDDGLTSLVDLVDTISLGGVFAPPAVPAVFALVSVDSSGRFIIWPGDIDFCADALQISGLVVTSARH
jgi:hypothetical protein